MKKTILSVCLILCVLCSCSSSSEENEFGNYTSAERALLCDFILYCQNAFDKKYTWSAQDDDSTLRFIARKYCDEDVFADIVDYEWQAQVDELIYTKEELSRWR